MIVVRSKSDGPTDNDHPSRIQKRTVPIQFSDGFDLSSREKIQWLLVLKNLDSEKSMKKDQKSKLRT